MWHHIAPKHVLGIVGGLRVVRCALPHVPLSPNATSEVMVTLSRMGRQGWERTWVQTHRGITKQGLCCIVLETTMWMSMSWGGWVFFPSLCLLYSVLCKEWGDRNTSPSSDMWSVEFQENGALPPPNTKLLRLFSLAGAPREKNVNVKQGSDFCSKEVLGKTSGIYIKPADLMSLFSTTSQVVNCDTD